MSDETQPSLVERLRAELSQANREDLMSRWDSVRADLLGGNRGDFPRLCFESWIDEKDGLLHEAAQAIERLEGEVASDIREIMALRTNLDAYISKLDEAVGALEGVMQALNDWLCIYASDMVDEGDLVAARKRVHEHGVIAYIADRQEVIHSTLQKIRGQE